MSTLPDLLRDADPLAYEHRNADARRRSRQRVLETRPAVEDASRRTVLKTGAGALALVAIAAGSRYWSQLSVDVVAAVRFEVRLAEESPAGGLREVVVSSGRKIYLHQEIVVGNSDITSARVVPGGSASTFNVTVAFNADGAEKMRRATEGHIGKPMAILIDGEVVMAPVVRSAIAASAAITGNFSRAEADRIVAGIVGR
jgi:preprotein translocase subunit SecD